MVGASSGDGIATNSSTRVEASQIVLVVLAEAYDPLWLASTTDESIRPIPVYGFANGFFVDEVKVIELITQFTGQGAATTSWLVTGSLGLVLLYLSLRRHLPPIRSISNIQELRTHGRIFISAIIAITVSGFWIFRILEYSR